VQLGSPDFTVQGNHVPMFVMSVEDMPLPENAIFDAQTKKSRAF
jgi:hypothetical protein